MNRYQDDYGNAYFRRIASNINKGGYRYIGKGSGRVVFDLGNGKVVKAAKNIKGIAQNIEEFRIAMVDDSGLFARVWDVSEDYRYLIMDKAERIRDISHVWDYFDVNNNDGLFHVMKLQMVSEKYNLLIHDFGRVVNWGLIGGRPMIIDYGFTRQVRRRFYTARSVLNTKN
jgi:hypothetical protein